VIPRLERVGDDTALADALAYLGYCALSLDDFVLLEQTADRLTRLAIFDRDPAVRATTLCFKAVALVGQGQPESAPRMARESVEILTELGQLDLAGAYAAVTLMRVDLLANLHHPNMVDDLIRRGEELDSQCQRQLGLPIECTAIEFVYGHFLRGDWDYVRENLRDPIAIRIESVPQVVRDIVHNVAAEIAEAEERLGDAEALLHYIAPTPSSPLGDHTFQQWLLAVERLISIRLRLHDLVGAKGWFEAMDAALEKHLHVPGELLLQLSLVRIQLAEGDAKAAYRVIADVVESARRISNTLVVVRGLRLMAQALQQIGKSLEALNAVTAAIDEAHRCRLVYEVALAMLERASIQLDTPGHEELGWTDLAEAQRIFERVKARAGLARCEEVARSHRRSKASAPAGLTSREFEVLRLLATGMSDRQIGEALFISARTVTTHVSNLLGKTTTSNRTELALWAAERKLAGKTHGTSPYDG
jgi:DNA-binding CsgD family transcriptional regulator